MDLDEIVRRQHGLCTREQALRYLTRDAIAHLLGAHARWQRILPAVYATFTGPLVAHHRRVAALLYAGTDAQLGSLTAVDGHALRPQRENSVFVLVPHHRRVQQADFIQVRRTTQVPAPVKVAGLPVSPVARAVVDSCRELGNLDEVRALVAAAVQQHKADLPALNRELRSGGIRGSALARRALAEVEAGARSAAEAAFRQRLLHSRLLPEPVWNAELFLDGRWIGRPDAWWEEAALVFQLDSVTWHLSPEDWRRTMLRHNQLDAAGLCVLHAPPSRVQHDFAGLIAELVAAYRVGLRRGPAIGVTRGVITTRPP